MLPAATLILIALCEALVASAATGIVVAWLAGEIRERLRMQRELRAGIRNAERVYALMCEYDVGFERAVWLAQLEQTFRLPAPAASAARSPGRRRSGAG